MVSDRDSSPLLPGAPLRDVLSGKAPLVGHRVDPDGTRGWVSPVEARVLMGIAYEDLLEAERAYLSLPRSPSKDAALVARVLFARLVTPGPGGPSPDRVRIVSAEVDNRSIDEAVDAILAPPSGGGVRMVHFVHAHALNVAVAQPRLAELIAKAQLVFPDGIGIRLAARLLGVTLRQNLNGTDLAPLLFRAAAERGVPLALIGARQEVIETCAKNLEATVPNLKIPIVSHGYLSDDEARELAERLRQLGRCLVMVGMGTPRQEYWAWEHLALLPEATVITVGGLFDFLSNRIPRAGAAWREFGLEWLFRMLQEPRRLGARYLLGNPLFLTLAVAQRVVGGADAAAPRTPR